MKKASSRSQRGGKSIEGKHVLQICVLFGVCIWLIFQVKYSHDNEFDEQDGKKSMVVLSHIENGVVKLGRKDLLPGYHDQKKNKKLVDEEEIRNGEEENERNSKVENGNHEEEEKEKEEEVVEEEDEDEIDEQDQSKSAGDTDKDDESVEEETENGSNEYDENKKENNHVDETVDEAREEHYKADDASSAVSHDYPILNTEKLKESSYADHKTPISADLTNKNFIQDESRNSTSESSLLENISDSNTSGVNENPRSEDYDESGSNLFSTELTEEADNTLETSIS